MPGVGGENVGTAYVRLIADGTGIPDDIRDALDKAKPVVQRAGKDHSEAYEDEWGKQASQAQWGRDLTEALERSFARADAANAFFGGNGKPGRQWKAFRKRAGDEFGDAGKIAADRLFAQFSARGNLEGLDKEIARFNVLVQKVHEDAADAQEAITLKERQDRDKDFDLQIAQLARLAAAEEEAEKARLKIIADFEKEHQALMRETDAVSRKISSDALTRDRQANDRQRVLLAERVAALADVNDGYKDLLATVKKLEQGEGRIFGGRHNTVSKIHELTDALHAAPGGADKGLAVQLRELEDRIVHLHPRAEAFNSTLDRMVDRLSRGTGRGSRNDFLHLIGNVTRGITSLALLGPRLAVKIGTTMSEAFTKAGGGISGMVASVGSLVPLLGTAAVAIGGLVIAAAALTVILGPLVALLSGLLAILTALSSTVVFAAIGALTALLGIFIPLGAAIGVVVLGLTNMSDALKDKLEKQIKPVTEAFKDLGKVAAETLTRDVGEQAKLLAPILRGLEPLVRKISGAVRDVGTSWLQSMSGKGFKQFVNVMERFLPKAIESLGEAISNTAGALGGMFRASVPFLQDFLGWLEKITGEWEEWANSADGQSDVRRVLEQAKESAKSLGNFLGEAIDLLATLFDGPGNKAGNNIFDRMADGLEDITQKIEKNPDALKEWFDFGEDTAKEIGDLLDSLGGLLDELDSPNARAVVLDFVDFLEEAADAMGDLAEQTDAALGPIDELIGVMTLALELRSKLEKKTGIPLSPGGAVEGLVDTITKLGPEIGTILFDVGINEHSIKQLLQDIGGLPGKIRGAVGRVDWSWIVAGIVGVPGLIARYFVGLGAKIVDRAGKVDWGRLIGNIASIPGRVLSYFAGMAGKIIARAVPVPWGQILQGLGAIPGRILGYFAGMAGKIIDRMTPIPWSQLGAGLAGFIATIPGMFAGLAGQIIAAIGTITVNVIPKLASGGIVGQVAPGEGPFGPGDAAGRIYYGPAYSYLGEDGPEAVVPLNRPLSQVDPAVRYLSAVAQGLVAPGEGRAGRAGKSIDASGWTIITPAVDARAAAEEALNYLIATSYTG